MTKAAFDSKQREAARELMASVVDSIPDGVHCVDEAGIITAMNPSARQLYGYPDAEPVGHTFDKLFPPPLRDHARRLHEQALGGEIVKRFPTVQVRIDGSEIAVAMMIIPIRGIDQGITRVALIATPMPAAALALSRSNLLAPGPARAVQSPRER